MTNASTGTTTAGMRKLGDLHVRRQKMKGANLDLTEIEEGIGAALDEVGREMMATALAAADVDDLEI
jgi:hypothetical protein